MTPDERQAEFRATMDALTRQEQAKARRIVADRMADLEALTPAEGELLFAAETLLAEVDVLGRRVASLVRDGDNRTVAERGRLDRIKGMLTEIERQDEVTSRGMIILSSVLKAVEAEL